MDKNKNKARHFTSLERKLFLDILKRYKHVIRSVQQLKKLWTNLKQNQRDALTKEKQARMARWRIIHYIS
ncbi:hypothetical protein ALC62_05710 [Cyphomyrmex costatus]|uniref:Regulatory protein zeste n=1 Tax=Cyphomyrmex costatus TaxID=456900 RepID=A0A151IJM9_9HYME|nr:hypothetical protein ALC62_05710 [Cyphomyrmex costatus]